MKLNKIVYVEKNSIKNQTIDRIVFENGEIKSHESYIFATLLEGLNTNKMILQQCIQYYGSQTYRVVGEIILDKEFNVLECFICKDPTIEGEIIIS